MLSAFIGFWVAVVSAWGMWRWRADLGTMLRGLMPLCFFFGGVIAIIAGLSTLRKGSNLPKGLDQNKPESH